MAKANIKDEPTPKSEEVFFVGLKRAPAAPGQSTLPQYVVVTGTLSHPVFDTVSQPLGNAAEAAKIAWLKMLDVIP